MTCGSCVNRITRALKRLDGVERVRVDLGRELVTVHRNPSIASDAVLAAAIAVAGYVADLDASVRVPDTELRGPLARLFRGRRGDR
jgi:Copper chaperone